MRRQGGNEASPAIIHTSSIALLQERFRNLQRVKEMREGRELQRVHHHSGDATDPDRAGSPLAPAPLINHSLQAVANGDEQPRWFLHPDLVRPSRPLHGAAGYSGHGGAVQVSQPVAATAASPWGDVPRMQSSGYRGDVDVDTSLHL
jgi:hypothetical protein